MNPKKGNNNGKAVINLRKVRGKEEWYLFLEISHLKTSNGTSDNSGENLNMTITTPVFDKSTPVRVRKDGTEIYAPIRDSRGVIICTSVADQKKCNKAEKLRKERQKELDRFTFYSAEEKKLYVQLRHSEEDFIAYFDDAIYRLHPTRRETRWGIGN